jgi:type I restriction enzyme, R subunit
MLNKTNARHFLAPSVRPVPTDIMCDPAGGTCGFPVAVGEYLRRHYPEIFRDPKLNSHFHLMGFEREFILPGFSAPGDFERFRAKARQFLKANENHIAVYKLRMNEPLTPTDLAELERMLSESGIGNAEDVQRAKEMSHGLGLFVRSLIGLDREAAKKALGSFLGGKPLRVNQIEFLNLIVDHLTEHGSMDARSLYDSPYTDFSPRGVDGVFESKEVDELLSVLEEVRKRAVG